MPSQARQHWCATIVRTYINTHSATVAPHPGPNKASRQELAKSKPGVGLIWDAGGFASGKLRTSHLLYCPASNSQGYFLHYSA